MLGAIYVGLGGMQTFSKGLQIISNNVTNMNTSGFKATSVSFSDAFNRGGLGGFHSGGNGRSFGAGVHLGSRSLDFSEGQMRQTGGALDLAIKGDGFLLLSGEDGRSYYGRTGQFNLDDKGYVTLLGSNYHLNVLDASGNPSAINLEDRRNSAPVATTLLTLNGNLSSDASATAPGEVKDMIVYDERGTRHVWKATFTRMPEETPPISRKWSVTVTDGKGVAVGSAQTLTFNMAGILQAPSLLTFGYTPAGENPVEVKLDFSGVNNMNSSGGHSFSPVKADGRGAGVLSKVTITEKGTLKLTYSNTDTVDVGSVAITIFRDLQKLEQVGNGLFRNDGSPSSLLSSEKDGAGALVSGQVEASNVDLSQQFGDLILIQRGFQASSQVVSVSNDMIQQLFGIRGQG
jgi:flagellar hook protein FlgE